jgi:hypothetical protein
VTLLPWEYLWLPFTSHNFPDLFDQTWIAGLALLVVVIVLYAIRTRALHRHRLYADMWEWLLWTGIISYSLVVLGAVFRFDFAVILVTAVTGLAVMYWVRFRRYPPLFEAYEQQLARQRYLARARAAKPEATIRTKTQKRRKRR